MPSEAGDRPAKRVHRVEEGDQSLAACLACMRSLEFGEIPRKADSMDPRSIDDLARRLASSVPEGLSAVRRDLEANFKAVLQSGLSKLDLVTRQEFDVQAGVLRRTREKLEALEGRLAALEKPKS
jgi:ubiquinone biosynthesis accessory factor UbiK